MGHRQSDTGAIPHTNYPRDVLSGHGAKAAFLPPSLPPPLPDHRQDDHIDGPFRQREGVSWNCQTEN
jgi:hypothetical protein